MSESVTVAEARRDLERLLDKVASQRGEVVIRRGRRRVAALVSVESLDLLDSLARRFMLSVLDRQRGGKLSEAEAMALANDAKHASRRRRSR